MPNITTMFAGFSVDDVEKAKQFYGETLGLTATINAMNVLEVTLGNSKVIIYPKPNHQPATYTVLNLIVPNIDEAVDDLATTGVQLEKYEGFHQDDKGIARSDDPSHGPSIAWFKDPAGNILSIIEDKA